MGVIEDAWRQVDAATEQLVATGKRVTQLSAKAAVGSVDGALSATLKALDGLADELEQMTATVALARAALSDVETRVAATNGLAHEVETELRALDPDRRVWRSMSEVVAFPVVLSVKGGKATIDKRSISSARPGVIIGTAMTALKEGSAPDRFVKALYAAFRIANGGRSSGNVPLTQIHQVLATVPPGGSPYSATDFRVDLQWLYASGLRSVDGSTLRFEPASAGPNAIPVYDAQGDLVNLGYVSFSESAGGDA